ncbi:MAG TPA: hypothetical protein PL190_03575 [Caldisericia bacterium]|nr:hypothetical protein [Caldisericia bacterium]HPA65592.1 hypothetical protein [Caldisericia bacterium]HQL67693.1 hypothetical protein [Caldisericia bacterium]
MKKISTAILLTAIFLAGCVVPGQETPVKPATSPKIANNDFFPLGWFTSLSKDEIGGLKDVGANFAITYVLSGRLKKELLSDVLDEAERKNIKVLLDVTSDWKWFDDDMPIPNDPIGNWNWSLDHAYSKRASHHGGWNDELNTHGFIMPEAGYPAMNVQDHDMIEQWVYIPSKNDVKELMIEFYASKGGPSFSWNHRVYWGEDLIKRGDPKEKETISPFRAGDLPKERDKWIKLTFRANDINLDATLVRGVNFINYGSQVYWDLMTRRTGKERIQERVNYLKGKKALFGWYLCDEPELRNIDPPRLKEIYDQIKEVDQEHIVTPVFQDWKVMEQYKDSCDIFFLDCYPVTVKSRSMDWMTQWVVEGARVAAKYKKPFVFVPQGFGDAPEYPLWTMPTKHELRWMTWTPIILGARGICYWAYYKASKEVIEESGKLFKEVGQYKDFLTKGTPVTGLSSSITSDSDFDGNPDLMYSAYDLAGKRLLMVSNGTSRAFDKVRLVGPGYEKDFDLEPYGVKIIMENLEDNR